MQLAPVTGGNRGLGRSIVEALADDGVDVVFTYRSPEKEAKEVVEAVAARGRHARALRLDTTEITAFADFTPPCVRHCGRNGTRRASTSWSTTPASAPTPSSGPPTGRADPFRDRHHGRGARRLPVGHQPLPPTLLRPPTPNARPTTRTSTVRPSEPFPTAWPRSSPRTPPSRKSPTPSSRPSPHPQVPAPGGSTSTLATTAARSSGPSETVSAPNSSPTPAWATFSSPTATADQPRGAHRAVSPVPGNALGRLSLLLRREHRHTSTRCARRCSRMWWNSRA
ncbi:SDR family NAD(P)-dependent oxidoreductase [Streptomyces sp. NPDC004166]